MMDQDKQMRLQAYFDGELPEREAREVEQSLATDAEAAALLREFEQTHQALAGFEESIRLPESREFFWSKIGREIQRQQACDTAPVPALSWAARLRRLMVPLASVAMLMALVMVSVREGDSPSGIETALEDSGAFTYHDFPAGTTLVWLSYPAETEPNDLDDLDAFE